MGRPLWRSVFLLQGSAWSAPTVDLEEPLGLGNCICDLTQGQCDLNCCCDPDCDAPGFQNLKDTFSCLPEGPASNTTQQCYSKNWMHSVNPRVDLWVVADDLRGLLCVSVDNNPVHGRYLQNEALRPAARLDDLVRAEQLSSFATTLGHASSQNDVGRRGYQAGDLLKAHYVLSPTTGAMLTMAEQDTLNTQGQGAVEVVAAMPLRSPDPLGACAVGAGQGVRFLYDVPMASCWTQPLDFTSACSAGGLLSPRLQLDTWRLQKLHLAEDARCGDDCVKLDFSQGPELLDPQLKRGSDGSCTCVGALRETHFSISFGYDQAQQVSITNVGVRFELQDIHSSDCQPRPVLQRSSLHFLQSIDGGVQPHARSGNPGYIVGLPLLVARCLAFEEGDARCASFGPQVQAVVPGILPGGLCKLRGATSSNTTSSVQAEAQINFGESAAFGCSLMLDRQELASLCSADNTSLNGGFAGYLDILPFGRLSSRWTHIAAFGSVPADAQDQADWVVVEESTRTEVLKFSDSAALSRERASNSSCTGAVVGINLEVL
eukprot:TRINITY_DN102664_c0_g1_i1.p1 TRINITY_DN102664_c0_g1~~TRINITY_DN102664_c0_g1_i1.p1  ORF type:complete len:546 (-),score=92.41 TRINITY_DN102664_c0_g1_i1:1-1638(-)